MAKRPKIPRHEHDLLRSLLHHLALLHEYSQRAFDNGEEEFLGEIAAKLRLLVIESRNNKPLLLGLMDHYNSQTKVLIEKPWGEKKLQPLRDYLADLCFATQTPSGGRAIVSNAEFIRLWSEQHGAAHEDWEHDEGYVAVRFSGLNVGGLPAHVRSLRAIARTIISVADSFLGELEQKGLVTREGTEA